MSKAVGRRGKPYVEAFPTLSLRAATKAWNAGQRIVEWINEEGTVIGHVELVGISEISLATRHMFFGTPNIEKSIAETTFQLRGRRVNPNVITQETICAACEYNVDCVYYVRGNWACKSCSGLAYLIERLSPSHKKLYRRDAVFHGLASRHPEHGTTDGVDDATDASKEAVQHVPLLSEQLRFRAVANWLPSGQDPKRSVEPGEHGYDWSHGQRRGFRAFYPADPIKEQPCLNRFPLDPALFGGRLFTGKLNGFLAERFSSRARNAAVQALRLGNLSTAELAALIARAASFEQLALGAERLVVRERLGHDGNRQLFCVFPYSGDPDLWDVKAPGSAVSGKLHAILDDSSVTLVVVPAPGNEDLARSVLNLGFRMITEQLAAQAVVIARFQANLAENARDFADVILSLQAEGRLSDKVMVNVDH